MDILDRAYRCGVCGAVHELRDMAERCERSHGLPVLRVWQERAHAGCPHQVPSRIWVEFGTPRNSIEAAYAMAPGEAYPEPGVRTEMTMCRPHKES